MINKQLAHDRLMAKQREEERREQKSDEAKMKYPPHTRPPCAKMLVSQIGIFIESMAHLLCRLSIYIISIALH